MKMKCSATSAVRWLAYHRSTTAMHNHLSAPSTGQQQSVASFMIRKTKSDARRAEQTTVNITEMIAQDMLPISFVEGKGFRTLMEFVEPEFTVPSRKTITARLEKLFDDNVRELRSQLASVGKIALTTDSRTALTTESYITITCHYIVNWETHSAVLQTNAMPERHTAENLANTLSTAMDQWGLSGKNHFMRA